MTKVKIVKMPEDPVWGLIGWEALSGLILELATKEEVFEAEAKLRRVGLHIFDAGECFVSKASLVSALGEKYKKLSFLARFYPISVLPLKHGEWKRVRRN